MDGASPHLARSMGVTISMAERSFNLVVPLAHKATDMRTTDTAGSTPGRSGAVSRLSIRPGDVDCTTGTPGTRTSTTATRTTTTRTTGFAPAPSADCHAPSDLFPLLAQAYADCRRTKRNSASALAFEARQEAHLRELRDELASGSYRPGPSVCFAITRPKPREVWAAQFRDRVVHHLLHNHIAPRFYARFIADSCACIPGRGTLYGAQRLERHVRSISRNWSRPAQYLKCDLGNFFLNIDKNILHRLLARHISEPWWLRLTETILLHDPRQDYQLRGSMQALARVPDYKQLTRQPAHLGLPIGNLPSQFFANVYLNELDQFVKHDLRCRHYVRYVDDFVLLHESPQWLTEAKRRIETFLADELAAHLNPRKTVSQPVDRGIDFVGQVIKPWRRTLRRTTFNAALSRVRTMPAGDLFEAANSYYGTLRQATHSHGDRAEFSNELRRRGHSIKTDLTKTYRRSARKS